MLAVEDGGDLLQTQGVLLDRQRGINRPYAVGTAQRGVRGQAKRSIHMADQLCDLRNLVQNGICDFKGRFFAAHGHHLMLSITVHRSSIKRK